MAIWQKAGIPTIEEKNCIWKIVHVINYWKDIHNPDEVVNESNLNMMVDLAPKLRGKVSEETQMDHLKAVMRKNSNRERTGNYL